MQYQEATIEKNYGVPDIHYILMLDDSGSMNGAKWSDLISSVTTFVETLENMSSLKDKVKISLIIYESYSRIIFKQQQPVKSLVNQMKYTGGGTDFGPPLSDALTLAKEDINKYDKIIMYFMSDGCAGYPT